MITYSDLYEAARKERYSEQLQKLSKNFIQEIAEYLKEKKQLSLKEEGLFSEMIAKTKKQLENAITLFRELMIRRRKKILTLVLIAAETGISKQDFDNMMVFERSLFEELIKNLENSDKKITEILEGKTAEQLKNELVVFKTNVEELLDMEGEKIGPFQEGQVANIPKEIARILIEDEKVEVLEK